MSRNPKFDPFHSSQNGAKTRKINKAWPKSNQFWRCLGYISMPNPRPLLPCHYLNQCWQAVNRNLGNKLQWTLKQNPKVVFQRNAFEDVVTYLEGVTHFVQASICWSTHSRACLFSKSSLTQLISTMGFPILIRWHLYIESRPWGFGISYCYLTVICSFLSGRPCAAQGACFEFMILDVWRDAMVMQN